LYEVAVAGNNRLQAYFIEASPASKNVKLYDEALRHITRKELLLNFNIPVKKKTGRHL